MKIATYLRVSTTDQSVEAQRLELAAHLANRGWGAAHEFSDVMSGTRKDRPGLDALLAAVATGTIDTVLCVKLDRMGRSLAHLARLIEVFDAAGVALICTSQGIDTSSANACGKFQLAVLGAVAAFERALIVERTVAGLAVARANGKMLGRPSPLLVALGRRAAIVAEWRTGGGRNYRALGVALGGVSGSTAWRVARRYPPAPAPAPAVMEVS